MHISPQGFARWTAAVALIAIAIRWLYLTFVEHYRFHLWPYLLCASVAALLLAWGVIRNTTLALLLSTAIAVVLALAALWIQMNDGVLEPIFTVTIIAATVYVAVVGPRAYRALTNAWSGRDT
jgi:hypothetical protein